MTTQSNYKKITGEAPKAIAITAPAKKSDDIDKWLLPLVLLVISAICAVWPQMSNACTRVVYQGTDSLYIIGRSLDWKTPIPTNLYVYPRGMHKVGSDKPGAVEWTSKYGAVYAVGYDGGVTEGMNEKGLSVNGLFCKGTVYNNPSTEGRPAMSLAVFPAWMLDLCSTTQEVVDLVTAHNFDIGSATFDGGTVSTLHWGVTDADGNTAIIEFDNGDIKVYQGRDLVTMTNDPQWPSMSAIIKYWEAKGGSHTLPGTVSSPDRCVRAHYFINHVKKVGDADLGASICRSVLECSSVPYEYTIETEPNVSSTQWRSFSNLRDLRYYFDVVTNNGLFYIDLNKCDFRPSDKVYKLDVAKSKDYVGEANKHLFKTTPFNPMY